MLECHPKLQFILIVSAFVAFFCVIISPVFNLISFNVSHEKELQKCPMCLGSNMCKCFENEHFTVKWDYFFANLLSIYLGKSPIFGTCGSQMVVLKWVENVQSSIAIDDTSVCNMEECSHTNIINSLRTLSRFRHSHLLGEDIILCPFTENLGTLLKPIFNGSMKSESLYGMGLYHYLLYSLQVNMEPNIQIITNQWAVAPYLGACGDITVWEYCGPTLTSVFPQLSWDERSSITRQLIHFAFNATFDNPDFAFYFTDLSPDNFAVSGDNKIRLVDLDNVIIVDKKPSEMPDNWDIEHMSYHDADVTGFAFSTEEVCSHRISDTNVYAICQGILSVNSDLLPGGLLRAAPPHLKVLNELVEDCTSPRVGQSRFSLAQSILEVLNDMSKN